MKKSSTWMLAIATIIIGIGVGSSSLTISNANGSVGSADDPVVTKSYVDQQIQKALGGSSSNSSSTSKPAANSSNSSSSSSAGSTSSATKPSSSSSTSAETTNNSTNNNNNTSTGNTSSSSDSKITIVELRPGKKLIADAGTQIIVRTGKALVYSEGTNGIIDVTAGSELGSGQSIPNNHMLLFPRDGRGVTVSSTMSYNATLMVIGSYGIQ